MKGFYIEITNNLLDPKHRKAMSTSVWEFMWCLDKVTEIGKENVGWVLGGKPIQLHEIQEDLGGSASKISERLTRLEKHGYIIKRRTPYGIVIGVNKAQKRFAQKGKTGFAQKGKSNSQNGKSHSEKGKSNIRQDNRQDNRQDKGCAFSYKECKPFFTFYEKYPNKKAPRDAHTSWHRAKDKPPLEELIRILEQHKQTDQWQKGYIPHPATWLNKGRWEDEIDNQKPNFFGK